MDEIVHGGSARSIQRSRWRSLLFVPGDNSALLEKAPRSLADGLIFDLEDAVADNQKGHARANLAAFAPRLGKTGADLLVRVNNDPPRMKMDVASIPAETQAVLLPKTECVDDLLALHGLLAAREAHLGLKPGSIGTVAMVESPSAIFQLAALSRAPRVIGLALGSEDLALALGVPPSAVMLAMPAQLICLAAAACGIMAFAIPYSIAAVRDIEGWAGAVVAAKALGATGGLCIHPAQVNAVNETFSPTAAEISWAQDVMQAWTTAEQSQRGVSTLDGAMIDRPVVQRAQTLLGRRRPMEKEPT
jgi:citrate lyase subunit beta/citryl-CoA lyase